MTSQWENVGQLIDALDQRVNCEPLNKEPVIISVEDVKSLLEEIKTLQKINMRIINEMVEVWIPIYELVKPSTPSGESVSVKAVELIKRQLNQRVPAIEEITKATDGLEIGELITFKL